jgi:hypothetical protein
MYSYLNTLSNLLCLVADQGKNFLDRKVNEKPVLFLILFVGRAALSSLDLVDQRAVLFLLCFGEIDNLINSELKLNLPIFAGGQSPSEH